MRESRSAASYQELLQGLKYRSSSYYSPRVRFWIWPLCSFYNVTSTSPALASSRSPCKLVPGESLTLGRDYLNVRRSCYCLLRQVVRDRTRRPIARPQAGWTQAEVWF